MNDSIIKLAIDIQNGVQNFNYNGESYDSHQAVDVLRKALIDANGGETTINRKTLRRHKAEIFEIIEELVPAIIREGFEGNEFFLEFVDERNLALGDKNEFYVPDNSTFVVSKVADGIATPDRQRIGKATVLSVPTSIHEVRMYDEFSRFMAGRIDWAELCDKVAKSFQNEMWNDIYTAFKGINATTIGLNANYVKSGTYDAATLRELIEHVEAANGESAVIVGTKSALGKCEGTVVSDLAKDSMYNAGYYGKFEGTPMIMVKQKHAPGTDTFLFEQNAVYVVAGGDKFIKFVNEGDSYIDDRDQTRNADMTVEYFMEMKWGVGVAVSGKVGKYTIAA